MEGLSTGPTPSSLFIVNQANLLFCQVVGLAIFLRLEIRDWLILFIFKEPFYIYIYIHLTFQVGDFFLPDPKGASLQDSEAFQFFCLKTT